ncbi:hypothetical protein HQ576_14870 [bacterium]|nr:hypothetical protein [bacterium]
MRSWSAILALSILPGLGRSGEVTVTLDPSVKHQTIRGWSCNPHYLGASVEQREQVIDDAVNVLGLTRVRWQQPNGNRSTMRRWELENDNGDPDTVDYARLNTADADRFIKAYLLPFRRRVEANGEPFELWLSPSFFKGGSTGDVPAFLLHSPGEYAEYATSFIRYLKDKYGVTTHHYAICNEAGNNNVFSPRVVIEMTKVLGERMAALGLPAKGQFSDGVNAHVTWRYIQAGKNDPELWKHVDVLSYHWYGGKNQSAMAAIRTFALQKGLATAQSEYMHLKIDHLYDDLTIGGVSYWSIYGLGGPGQGGQNYHFHLNGTSFHRGKQFWNFRQVLRYVRPGAVRIGAASDDPAVRVLAFAHRGTTTVVLINTSGQKRARPVRVRGLLPGRYGVCQSVGTRPYQELGLTAAGEGGTVGVTVAAGGALTLYPYPGRNLPPVATHWGAAPDHLKAPASRVTLSASAQDPERGQLTYSWAVTRQPNGAKAALADPASATTAATGLSVPGLYGFAATVSDGVNEIAREVLLNVFEGNQPPRLLDVHNRIPVLVTLPHDNTLLIGGAFDLDGDRLSFRWSVVRQPDGSAAKLETPTQQKCRLTNITVAGDIIVRFEVSDGHHTVAEDLTVPVYPANAAPVIETVKAEPATLTLPAATTALSATTRDTDGDVISHWWRVARTPAGATPVFSKQGGHDTAVNGLNVAGVYVFTLTVVDRAAFAQKDVTVVVHPKGGPPPATQGDPPAERAKDGRTIAHGVVTGTVARKGKAWLEVRSASGKTTRYIPHWSGGMPRDGGGPDKATVRAIAQVQVGQRVSIRWAVDHHVRIETIRPAP